MIEVPIYFIDYGNEAKPNVEIDGSRIGFKDSYHRADLMRLMRSDHPRWFLYLDEQGFAYTPKVELRYMDVWGGERWVGALIFDFERDADGLVFMMWVSGQHD